MENGEGIERLEASLQKVGLQVELQVELERLVKLVERFNGELSQLPEGRLVCRTIRGYRRYYQHFEDGTTRYLSRKKDILLGKLIRKRFISESIPWLQQNIKVLTRTVKSYHPYEPSQICVSGKEIPMIELLKVCEDETFMEKDEAWLAVSVKHNPKFPERLIQVTTRGDRVRSKSEAIIASFLYSQGIPYCYEAALELDSITFYPDFTIRRPRDGRIIYWEHFGMIGDAGYEKKIESKLRFYREHQITPWNNLLTTYDNPEGGIDLSMVSSAIRCHLLS